MTRLRDVTLFIVIGYRFEIPRRDLQLTESGQRRFVETAPSLPPSLSLSLSLSLPQRDRYGISWG